MSASRLAALRPWIVAGVFVAAVVVGIVVLWAREESRGLDFDLVAWEYTTIPNKWLYLLGAPARDDPPPDEAIRRYFALESGSTEAAALENAATAAIEGRIDAVARDLGLSGRVPIGGVSVFPPVDVELAASPRVLVTSPRAHIERLDTDLLQPDLRDEHFPPIEEAVEEADPDLSALVVGSGGVATYPAIVGDGRGYASTLATATHEWIHHYLAFYPLGAAYYISNDLRTINETVASIAGDELAHAVLARYGDPTVLPPEPTAAPELAPEPEQPRAPQVNQFEVLRELRLDVDELLAAGQVEEAEALMERTRQELCEAGICYRKINQAFFAWNGTYAARPDAVDPLGDQLREIRERAGSLDRFLALVREVESRAEVERLLESLRGDEAAMAGG